MNTVRLPDAALALLTCPVCGTPLRRDERTMSCAAGHAFDLARQGYLNLLPGRGPRSARAGDDRTMLASRRRFLDSGAYSAISQVLNRLVLEHGFAGSAASDTAGNSGATVTPPALLDAGCGEGYYLEGLRRSLSRERQVEARLLGVDVSKHAVRMACGRSRDIAWVAASSAHLPVAGASLDAIVCVFAPVFEQAFAEKLKPGGALIVVGPGPRHLFELKQRVYDTPREFEPDHGPQLSASRFAPIAREAVRLEVDLAGESIGDLLSMTPYTWSATREQQERIHALASLRVTVDVVLTVFRRPGP
jgi:23S rRNA (guanine745-N1)-methyltransferase